jgi:hypothetical protein
VREKSKSWPRLVPRSAHFWASVLAGQPVHRNEPGPLSIRPDGRAWPSNESPRPSMGRTVFILMRTSTMCPERQPKSSEERRRRAGSCRRCQLRSADSSRARAKHLIGDRGQRRRRRAVHWRPLSKGASRKSRSGTHQELNSNLTQQSHRRSVLVNTVAGRNFIQTRYSRTRRPVRLIGASVAAGMTFRRKRNGRGTNGVIQT